MDINNGDIKAYITSFSPEIQSKLKEIRNIISSVVPLADETISYGIPTFKMGRNLVHYAGYKKHIGFYPGAFGIANFKNELEKFKHAKGSVQFPHQQPLPKMLIKKIVKFKVQENLKNK